MFVCVLVLTVSTKPSFRWAQFSRSFNCCSEKPSVRQGCTWYGTTTRKLLNGGGFGFFICVVLDSHRFWIFPIRDPNKFTVKEYDNFAKYRELENPWKLLEKLGANFDVSELTWPYKSKFNYFPLKCGGWSGIRLPGADNPFLTNLQYSLIFSRSCF